MDLTPVDGGVFFGTFYELIKYCGTSLTAFSYFKRYAEEKNLLRKNSVRVQECKLQKALELAASLEDYEESTNEEKSKENSILQDSLIKLCLSNNKLYI